MSQKKKKEKEKKEKRKKRRQQVDYIIGISRQGLQKTIMITHKLC
jgi:hypothetical protein